MAYDPKPPPTITSLDELISYVDDELQMISQEFREQTLLFLRPVFREPTKPREGMIAFADGTSWNPGSGRGTYEYRSGAWAKL